MKKVLTEERKKLKAFWREVDVLTIKIEDQCTK